MKKTILILAFALLAAVSLIFVACDSAKTPEDTTPDTTVTTDAPTDGTEAPAKEGCGSTLVVGLLAVLIPAAWIVLRKREA